MILMTCIGCVSDAIEYSSYKSFEGTKAWNLAKAIDCGDTAEIGRILQKDSSLINYQDSSGWSILMHVVHNQTRVRFPLTLLSDSEYGGRPEYNPDNMKTFKYLLEKGANVNIHDHLGKTALAIACKKDVGDDTYVKLLLEYGAKTEIEVCNPAEDHIHGPYTPLMLAVQSERKDYVDLLLKHGADINYSNEIGACALSEAMWMDYKRYGYTMVLYLLQKGVDYTKPYCYYGQDHHKISFIEDLRSQPVKLGSDRHKQKMKIIEFLKIRGMDYYKIAIPDNVVEYAKREYPNSWETYLKEY